MILLSSPRCSFPECPNPGEHRHHITYEPEVVKSLCRKHHEDITIINRAQAGRIRAPLSNKHRWWIWFGWLNGKLKPRRTNGAREYVAAWEKIC